MKKNGLRLLRRRMQDLLKTVNDGRLSNKNQSQLTVGISGVNHLAPGSLSFISVCKVKIM